MANERARALGFDFITDDKYLRSPFKAPIQGGGEDASTESFGIPYTNAFTGSGGGSGGSGGSGGAFGLFGDLDQSTEKTFNRNVWDGTDWVSKEVKGYKTPSGYKTYAGLNIDHAGLEVQPMFAHVLGLTKKGPQIGDIEGTFTNGAKSGMDKIKKGWEEEKDKWAGITGIKKAKTFFKKKKEEKLQEELAQQSIDEGKAYTASLANAPQHHQDVSINRGDHQAQAFRSEKAEGIDTKGSGMHGGKHYAKGGRAGYFFGGRVNYKVGGRVNFKNGGLASIL